jgi:hypothetical protein
MGAASDADAPTTWGALGFKDASQNYFGGYFNGNAYVSGYEGIATTTPTQPLDIGTSNFATTAKFGAALPICLVANSPMVGFNAYWSSLGATYYSSSYAGMIQFDQDIAGGFQISTAPSGTALTAATLAPRMTILNNGNVGIGTVAPSAPLNILSTGYPGLQVDGSDVGWAGMYINATAGGGARSFYGYQVGGVATVFTIADNVGNWYLANNGIASIYAASSGFVGLNNQTPAVQLDVAGQTHVVYNTTLGNYTGAALRIESPGTTYYPGLSMYDDNNSSGVLLWAAAPGLQVCSPTNAWAPVFASAFTVSSDKTVKKDINNINQNEYDAYLNQIRNIESITYRYNYEDAVSNGEANQRLRETPHVGFTAQSLPSAVVAQLPETPGDSKSAMKLGYNLSDMAGLTLVGVKALDSKVTGLDTK